MAEALVKFFLKRLDSLLLQETETFSGLEDQIERLTCTLREIGEFFENKDSTEGDAAVLGWLKELRGLIDDMEDHIDEFIIQMDQQNGPDKLVLTNCFTNELQKIESRLAETDEVEGLIHLKYLGLKHTDLRELPARLGNLRALQTLDIRWCGYLTELPIEVLNLVRLRHLKMFKNMGVCGMKLPAGIGRLRNLLTLTGIHAGGGIAGELGDLIHLRRLGVMDVNAEIVSELFSSLMKMQDLLSLSLEAKHGFDSGTLVLLESFSPPPLVRKLRLEGILEKIPNWIGSMENLTKLRLGFSHLSESPTTVLQLLPNLKNLTLWQASDAKQLGKEFCRIGGFPKLEVLTIASHLLEEWTEVEEGALPSLKYLCLRNCMRLRMLPEGLQFVTTLKQLDLIPLHDEHAERLKPDGGEENHKIRHIPCVSFMPMSVVQQRFEAGVRG